MGSVQDWTRSLIGRVDIVIGADAAVAGTSDVESIVVDTDGLLGVAFLARIAVANPGNYLEVSQSDEDDMSGAAALVDAKAVALADNDLVLVDVMLPQKRYLQAKIERTASTATGDMIVVPYTAAWQVCEVAAAFGLYAGAAD